MSSFSFVLLTALAQIPPEDYSLTWATMLGGSNFERAQGCDVDAQGFIYICGNTSSPDLPTTPGAFQTSYGGDSGGGTTGGDGYVAKLSPDGTNLIWCTYIGGSDGDRSYGVQVDAQGFVYVASWAGPGFPTTPGAFDTTHNSPGVFDVAITKFLPDGSGLVWSTFIGGNGKDQSRGSMYVDASGTVYSSGWTDSSDFPTTPGAYQTSLAGGTDAFAYRLSADGSQLLFSTYFGGSANEQAYTEIAVHSDGSVYFPGTTRSADLPVTSGAYQTAYGGHVNAPAWHGDAFVVRLNSTGSNVVYATYIGGVNGEEASANNGFVIDSAGRAILLGNTTTPAFPTTPGAYQTTHQGGNIGDAFIAIFSTDGSQLIASTLIGGSGNEESSGIAIDGSGNLYFSGNTDSSDFPVTANAFQSTHAGGAGSTDAWFAKISPDLSTLLYSTFLGGSGTQSSGGDRGRCVALGPSNTVLVTGDTNSPDYPATPGTYQTTYQGGVDSQMALFTLSTTPSDTTPPSITITSPTSGSAHATSATPITLGGSASDNVAVSLVDWSNAATGATGSASGTPAWSATIALAAGPNDITVTAWDAAGNSASDAITVTYTPSSDSDGDGLPDSWETQHFGNLNEDAGGDPDADGLSNQAEHTNGTDPTNPDTDGDGFTDGQEVTQGTDPLNPSSFPGSGGASGGGGSGSSGGNCGATGFEALLLIALAARVKPSR